MYMHACSFHSCITWHTGPLLRPKEIGMNAWWDFCQYKHSGCSPHDCSKCLVRHQKAQTHVAAVQTKPFDACENQKTSHRQVVAPNENKIRSLACFSRASIKVDRGRWFSCLSIGLEAGKPESHVDITCYCCFFCLFCRKKKSHFTIRAPFNNWLARREEKKGNIFNSLWSCCAQDVGKNINLTSTLIDTIPHTGLKVDKFRI